MLDPLHESKGRHAIGYTVIGDNSYNNPAVWSGCATSQKERCRRQGMRRFKPRNRNIRDPESAEIIRPLAPDIEAQPPDRPTQEAWQARDPQSALEISYLVQRSLLGVSQYVRDFTETEGRGILNQLYQNAGLSFDDTIDGNSGNACWILIQVWPWKFDESAPSLGDVLHRYRAGLSQNCRPGRARRAGVASSDERAEIHGSLDRYAGYGLGQAKDVSDDPAGDRETQ
jgi:hypothetical protein